MYSFRSKWQTCLSPNSPCKPSFTPKCIQGSMNLHKCFQRPQQCLQSLVCKDVCIFLCRSYSLHGTEMFLLYPHSVFLFWGKFPVQRKIPFRKLGARARSPFRVEGNLVNFVAVPRQLVGQKIQGHGGECQPKTIGNH